MICTDLTLARDGAEHLPGAASEALGELESIASRSMVVAGTRLQGDHALRRLLRAAGALGRLASDRIGPAARPVRAILFDKSPGSNWSLAWHQDRTIAVRARREVQGFDTWTVKRGMLHVEPPMEILESMLTLRVHLDDVPIDNAPLLVALGSHRFGRVAEGDIDDVVTRCGVHACTANAGDVWLCATPILHASDAARKPLRRRVLQVDYAAGELPGGLQWLGV